MPSRRRRKSESRPAGSHDDGGNLLFLLFVLWMFGFVSFHSRETGRAFKRVTELRAELSRADARLAELTNVVGEMRSQSEDLDARRESLRHQVTQLEQVRDRITVSLRADNTLVAQPETGRWQAFGATIFSGVLGNLVAAAIIAVVAWLLGQRAGKASTLVSDVSEPS